MKCPSGDGAVWLARLNGVPAKLFKSGRDPAIEYNRLAGQEVK